MHVLCSCALQGTYCLHSLSNPAAGLSNPDGLYAAPAHRRPRGVQQPFRSLPANLMCSPACMLFTHVCCRALISLIACPAPLLPCATLTACMQPPHNEGQGAPSSPSDPGRGCGPGKCGSCPPGTGAEGCGLQSNPGWGCPGDCCAHCQQAQGGLSQQE